MQISTHQLELHPLQLKRLRNLCGWVNRSFKTNTVRCDWPRHVKPSRIQVLMVLSKSLPWPTLILQWSQFSRAVSTFHGRMSPSFLTWQWRLDSSSAVLKDLGVRENLAESFSRNYSRQVALMDVRFENLIQSIFNIIEIICKTSDFHSFPIC